MSKKLTLIECKSLSFEEALKRYDECENELTFEEAMALLDVIDEMRENIYPLKILPIEEAIKEWIEDGTWEECALDEEDMKFYEEKFGPIDWSEVL